MFLRLFFSARVQGTEKQISELEKQAEDNMQLTRDAKMKVGKKAVFI